MSSGYSPIEVLESFNIHGLNLEDERIGRVSLQILLNNTVKNKEELIMK